MKRDVDLLRAILLEIENEQKSPPACIRINLPDHSEDEITFQVMILEGAGLIEAEDFSTDDRMDWRPLCLTQYGQDFLDATRSDETWAEAKQVTLEKYGALGLYLIRSTLRSMR